MKTSMWLTELGADSNDQLTIKPSFTEKVAKNQAKSQAKSHGLRKVTRRSEIVSKDLRRSLAQDTTVQIMRRFIFAADLAAEVYVNDHHDQSPRNVERRNYKTALDHVSKLFDAWNIFEKEQSVKYISLAWVS